VGIHTAIINTVFSQDVSRSGAAAQRETSDFELRTYQFASHYGVEF
jgi:hypothetical protein